MKNILSAFVFMILATILAGVVYPLGVWVLGLLVTPSPAPILQGQDFQKAEYFWPRPSNASYDSTKVIQADAKDTNSTYNGANSGGYNTSARDTATLHRIRVRDSALRSLDPNNHQAVPIDLVTASGSGLDPNISMAAAQWQLARVARARHLDSAKVEQLLQSKSEGPWWSALGSKMVNVVTLNQALDKEFPLGSNK